MKPENIELIELFGQGAIYGALACIGPALVGLAWSFIKWILAKF